MKKISKCIIFCILILLTAFPLNNYVLGTASDVAVENDNQTPDSIDSKLYTDCLLLIHADTGDILYEKNANKKMYPASTTKILTAIIVLEKSYLNERVTVSSSAINAVPSSYTKANLKAGEEFTVEELLNVLLIPSANDAANVLAEHVSGSTQEFANLMNEKARAIGLNNSHFTNPSGIHNEELYSTASDLALIARYAMKIEKFRDIVKKTSCSLPPTSLHPEDDRHFETSNLLLKKDNSTYYYEYTTGVKTGFTSPAGDCLVASAKKDDIEFIAVCLNSSTLDNGLREKFLDCKTLFEYAFSNYTTHYQNLQEEKEEISLAAFEEVSEVLDDIPKSKPSFFRTLSKILAIIIILFAIKRIFFRKKKNRRKKHRKRHK